ncbi:MAG: hypothetical protein ABIH92_05240 [Nanoarchaeota archaeon]
MKKVWWILIIVLVAFIVIIASAYFYAENKKVKDFNIAAYKAFLCMKNYESEFPDLLSISPEELYNESARLCIDRYYLFNPSLMKSKGEKLFTVGVNGGEVCAPQRMEKQEYNDCLDRWLQVARTEFQYIPEVTLN